ncbi:MAG: hypothetical protein ED559_01105 [Phycisphaera sp.]|nr:MAG: hypothetical protein ED559_01105 [Phycisphaera sp.]
MERVDIESRLRGQRPAETEPPGWVRTRVMSRVGSEPQAGSQSAVSRVALCFGGCAAMAAIALAIVLWPSQNTVNNHDWAAQQPARINLPISTKIPTAEVLTTEGKRLQEDMVQITSLVSVPIRRLGGVVKQY